MQPEAETRWNLYTSNQEIQSAILIACENATTSIDFEQFIFVVDEVGKKFIDVCARKAAQGVKVRFMWDAAGSFSFFGSSTVDELRLKGIELIFFKTLLPDFFKSPDYRSWYFRDHRRTVVIDGKIGFTGSYCNAKYTENWRDTSLRIEGPVVKTMQECFDTMWMRAQDDKPENNRGRKRARRADRNHQADTEFMYVTNTPLRRNRLLYNRVVEAIRNARKYIYIETPYFVPTHRLARVLRLAAHRGIDVKIIMSEKSDHPIVDLGARTFFHQMLRDGVKIFLYKDRILHSKTIVIDGDWSTVGTLNMDNISLLYNFEANIVTTNSRFAEELASHFVHDMHNSNEITFEEWQKRFFVEKIASFFVRFFRSFL